MLDLTKNEAFAVCLAIKTLIQDMEKVLTTIPHKHFPLKNMIRGRIACAKSAYEKIQNEYQITDNE